MTPGDKKPKADGSRSRGASPRGGHKYRLKRMREESLKPPLAQHPRAEKEQSENFALDCGWGRLVFAQTFNDLETLSSSLREEKPDRRDIAIYVRDPHVLLANAPQEMFLDPSHTYRLQFSGYRASKRLPKGFFIRRLTSQQDATAINRIYASCNMIQVPPDFFWSKRDARSITYFVAEDEHSGEVIGTVTGIDHFRAFGDHDHGSSLWCLAVDPQARHPGIGESMIRHLAEHMIARGAAYLDLSVIHDNEQAIGLYDKLGFKRVPFFSIKRKNQINEALFSGPAQDEELNAYAQIIINEARRRGIQVDVLDAEGGFFRLTQGGVTIRCRESLTDLTSSVSMAICDDKATTRRVVSEAGVKVPDQIVADAPDQDIAAFLEKYGNVVVKPARGEQGRGISVGLETVDGIEAAIKDAKQYCDQVLVEECVEGMDLRLVVINFRVVAAAIRKPPVIAGNGRSTVRDLIKVQSRRREAATDGESSIPLDQETERTVCAQGYDLDSILEDGEELVVRKTANLHTGGTIHDVTDIVHPDLVDAAIKAARAIDIPVTGIDFMVKSASGSEYAFVEANERPGLANHEPQPTAERFIDLLFPLSMPASARQANQRQSAENEKQKGET